MYLSVPHCLQTNDSGLVGVVKMENFALVKGAGVQTDSSRELRLWLEASFRDNLVAMAVKGEGVAVVEFKPGSSLEEMMSTFKPADLTFAGAPLQLFAAYLVWMPLNNVSLSIHKLHSDTSALP